MYFYVCEMRARLRVISCVFWHIFLSKKRIPIFFMILYNEEVPKGTKRGGALLFFFVIECSMLVQLVWHHNASFLMCWTKLRNLF